MEEVKLTKSYVPLSSGPLPIYYAALARVLNPVYNDVSIHSSWESLRHLHVEI